MMKKAIATIIVAGLATTSSMGFAADDAVSEVESGKYIENTAAGCSILRDRVTINTSTGVTLAYHCRTEEQRIDIAGCHASGSQKPTTVRCQNVADDGAEPIYNDPSCTGTTEDDTFEIQGRRGYVGSSTGGSISAASLNSTTCDMDALGGLESMR